jgi:hypothetical protein
MDLEVRNSTPDIARSKTAWSLLSTSLVATPECVIHRVRNSLLNANYFLRKQQGHVPV